MSKARRRANEKNALRSTGPRTPKGKASSSKNSTKHGIASISPVVAAFESQADWEAHRSGLLDTIAPEGALEAELAEHVAHLTWRLRRVTRYEAENIAIAQASADDDLDSAGTARVARLSRSCAKTIQRLRESADDDPVKQTDAWSIQSLLAQIVRWDEVELAAACVPDGDAPQEFDGWTVGLLRRAIAVAAKKAGTDPSALERMAVEQVLDREERWNSQLKQVERDLARRRRERVLPDGKTLEMICRYEAHLRRSLLHTIHELLRLQAARLGAGAPLPAALDVNVAVSPGAGPA